MPSLDRPSSVAISTTEVARFPGGVAAWLSLLDQCTDDGVWYWDILTETFHWSDQLRKLLRLEEAQPGNQLDDFEALLNPEDRERAQAALQKHLRGDAPFQVQVRLRTRPGVPRWLRLRCKALRDAAGKPAGVTGFVTDITHEKQAEEEREGSLADAEQLSREMAVLNELSQALTARLSVEEVVAEAHHQAARLLDTSNFYIAIYHSEAEEVEFVLNVTESVVDRTAQTRRPANRGITGYIIRHRVPVLIKENYNQWLAEHGVAAIGQRALSWLGVPMRIADRVLGVIAVQSYQIDSLYDEHDQELLTAIASAVAIALQNAQLFTQRQKDTEQIRMRSEQITALVAPIIESVEQIAAITRERANQIGELARMTQASTQKMLASRASIEQLAEQVALMCSMIEVIDSISLNVNLLALNASIESAHAGAYGKGFSVIADEIRNFSVSTKRQAREIGVVLKTVLQGARQSAEVNRESFVTFQEVERNIKDFTQFLDDVSRRMIQLSSASANILQLMKSLEAR